MSKALLIDAMVRKSGMDEKTCRRALECVLGVFKAVLKEGWQVEVEGLGMLQVVARRPSKRRIVKGLKNVSPTIVEEYKHRKTVRLRKVSDISYKEK
jgi:nucleoid DNA-binding protein